MLANTLYFIRWAEQKFPIGVIVETHWNIIIVLPKGLPMHSSTVYGYVETKLKPGHYKLFRNPVVYYSYYKVLVEKSEN